MRIAHVLRKYNPSQWGGTETAVKQLLDGLRAHQAEAQVFCPACGQAFVHDPLAEAGHRVERFRAFVPVWGLSPDQKKQLVSVGGNLMSLDLLWKLQRAQGLSVIHTHALNRLGGIAATIARVRRLPFVVTIHGGVLDLPEAVRQQLLEPLRGGLEWGKLFGWLVRSRRVLDDADAIITCNRREAALLKEKYPDKVVFAQPHGVPAAEYQQDDRSRMRQAFPQLASKRVLLVVGRIDPVKNQAWLVQQFPRALALNPDLHMVLAGSCTDEPYGKLIKKEIRNLGLEPHVTLTGGLPPGDPRLIGLFQGATAIVVPSLSETFGLVILEAWAAGRPVLASRTSGALDVISHAENGWLFELSEPESFHRCLDQILRAPERAAQAGESGRRRVEAEFDCAVLARRVKHLYEELIGELER
jgi:glycosyltransferase involved in cell wall biosynthesis